MALKSLGFTLIVAIVGVIVVPYLYLTKTVNAPKMDLEAYWGPGDPGDYKAKAAIRSFKINYNQSVIDDIRDKLKEPIILPSPLEGTTSEYGMNVAELRDLLRYWRDEYLPQWRDRQNFLNSLPQFKTNIQGLSIHYIHIKPQNVGRKRIVPLLLLHGWPGSIREFYDFIPMLINPPPEWDYAFEVVAPSLPGFGFSDGAAKQKFGTAEVAVVLRNLMIRLGHEKFVIQGGDWGSILGSAVTTLFPNNVIGYHSNFCILHTPLAMVKWSIANLWPSLFIDPKYESFVFPMSKHLAFLIQVTGYFHIQATKPDTIGIALTRNPIGLASYFMEKFSGALPGYDQVAILDNLMIYYLTDSATTSFRLYAEGLTKQQRSYNLQAVASNVPTGCVRFERDIMHAIDWQLSDKYTNLIHSSWKMNAGHFAALEAPAQLYEDFLQFVTILFGTVKN